MRCVQETPRLMVSTLLVLLRYTEYCSLCADPTLINGYPLNTYGHQEDWAALSDDGFL